MKISDFKLITTLPEEYDYTIFNQNHGEIMILGKRDQSIIGFMIQQDQLVPIKFTEGSQTVRDKITGL